MISFNSDKFLLIAKEGRFARGRETDVSGEDPDDSFELFGGIRLLGFCVGAYLDVVAKGLLYGDLRWD